MGDLNPDPELWLDHDGMVPKLPRCLVPSSVESVLRIANWNSPQVYFDHVAIAIKNASLILQNLLYADRPLVLNLTEQMHTHVQTAKTYKCPLQGCF